MKLGFIILAHNQPDAVRRLVRILADREHQVVVHFDKSAPADQHAEVRKLKKSYPGQVRIISRVHCVWGEWSLVEAVLVALREFREMPAAPEYVHLMSGADFPIRPIADFEEFLRTNPDQDFIECCDITQRRWVKGGLSMERFRFYFPVNFRTSRKTFDRLVRWHRKLKIRRKIPLGMTPHMGSQWWTLRWTSCESILDFLRENPKVVRYFRSTWIPDESFFQTVLAHLVPTHEIADLQLMLHHLTATGRPYVVYPDHLPRVAELPHFFVRKVAPFSLEGLEKLVVNRQSAIPNPDDLVKVRDEIRGGIDKNYELQEIVPGHPHGPPQPREYSKLLVFLTMSDAETALVRAYAAAASHTAWIGCPIAEGGIQLTEDMQAATGLTPDMTAVREQFTDQFVDTIAAALPEGKVSVAVLRLGDLGENSWSISRIPSAVFVSAHLQLLPHWLPSARVLHVPERRFKTTIGEDSTTDAVESLPHWEIHHFLRAGHYYLLDATLDGTVELPESLKFILPSIQSPEPVESLYSRRGENSIHLIALLWVDDGAFLGISPPTPAYLLGEGATGNIPLPEPLHEVDDLTVDGLIPLLESFGDPAVWSDRLLLEALTLAPIEDRYEFFTNAKEHWPASRIDELTQALVQDSSPHFFKIAAMEEEENTEDLVNLAKSGEPETAPWNAVRDSIRVLATRDLSAACQLAIRAIEAREIPEEALIEAVEPCLPKDSKWWPVALGKDRGLGAEQKADAFNSMGVAAFHKGDLLLAELCYVTAVALNQDSQAVAWNLGLLRASRGRTEDAVSAFAGVQRHYSNESICTAWPVADGKAWPESEWPTTGFSLPDGITEWPRITVVTPSYNQAEYLGETIQSILRQQYPNLQFIVVDGASTDGSREILERYRNQFDHLIIEPDDGQTQAINKGLKLADGELVAWLNSDDIYGPGALHQIALRYLSSGADVIAGICAEHRAHQLQVVNRPSATNRDFNTSELARIFPNWFAGKFFFQPEVFFTRALIEKVGLLDESLYFTMDYDLWMRFAKAGATLDVVPWPVAFFRVHDAQKTSRSDECIAEQCEVRNRYHSLQLNEQRSHQIARQLSALSRDKPKIVLCAPFFEDKVATIPESDRSALLISPEPSADDLEGAAAVVVLIGSSRSELPLLQGLREQNPDLLIAGWFLDTGCDPHANHDAAMLVDVIIPSAEKSDDYLRHDAAVFTATLAARDPLPISDCIDLLKGINPGDLTC